jgi:RND superfamily putative drug exporter
VQPSNNLAARAGRWSAKHRKTAIIGWLTFVILAFMIGGSMGTKELDASKSGVGESGRASEIVAEAFPDEKSSEQVLIQSKTSTARSPQFKLAVSDVKERLVDTKGVEEVESGEVSADGQSQLVTYELPGDAAEATDAVEAPIASIAAAAKAHPELRIEAAGAATVQKAVVEADNKDFAKAEVSSLPITLIVLVIAFGALVAAGIPLLLAVTGVLGTMGLVALVSQLTPVAGGIKNLVLLVGLAVGVDYSLFYLRRAREARAAGHGVNASVEAAAATSGRAVLVSGLTVMVSMAGMYFAGVPMFESFATGTIIVVAVSVIGSLTVLPALMSALGDKVEKGRIPFLGRLKSRVAAYGIWSRIIDRVLRRPVVSVVLAGGLLLALSFPVLGMHTALPGNESLSRDLPAVQTYDRIQAAFPSESSPVAVVVKADDVTVPKVTGAIADLGSRTAEQKELYTGKPEVEVSDDGTVATIMVPAAGDGTNELSNRALDEMRGEIVPQTLGQVSGVEAAVTGQNAGIRDFNASLKSHIPIVFAFVLIAAFLLLLVTFRSIVIPLKAIVLNLLSVGAAYGVLVLVFQKGWGEELLGFESTGAVTAWLPPFLFVILFGLSMDYHVFIISRIREAFDSGMSTEDAVSTGIKSTAGVVSSAAAIMVGVFAIFGTLHSIDMKQMGVGLAVAIAIDATLIRGVLLPASMKLLGDRNWWLPKKLNWLPKVAPEGSVEVAPTTA